MDFSKGAFSWIGRCTEKDTASQKTRLSISYDKQTKKRTLYLRMVPHVADRVGFCSGERYLCSISESSNNRYVIALKKDNDGYKAGLLSKNSESVRIQVPIPRNVAASLEFGDCYLTDEVHVHGDIIICDFSGSRNERSGSRNERF